MPIVAPGYVSVKLMNSPWQLNNWVQVYFKNNLWSLYLDLDIKSKSGGNLLITRLI